MIGSGRPLQMQMKYEAARMALSKKCYKDEIAMYIIQQLDTQVRIGSSSTISPANRNSSHRQFDLPHRPSIAACQTHRSTYK